MKTAITEMFGSKRDLLVGYRQRDVVYVWMGSVGAGALAFIAFMAAVYAVEAYKAARKALVTFTVDDLPLTVLLLTVSVP